MVCWNRHLKKKLQDEGIKIKMYSRYVDYINIVCEAIDMKVEGEEVHETTLKSIQEIANKIHKSIQVTIDYPSNHENRRMPVLDLEQWIQQNKVEGEHKCQILHCHYMKKIAGQRVTSKGSALSMQTKISILVSDLVRVMRNVSEPCDEKGRSTPVQHYIHRMQFSGYPQEDRVLVYKKARKVFENIVERDRIGECPMYRGKFCKGMKETRQNSTRNISGMKRGVMRRLCS